MIEFILDYMENNGLYAENEQEQKGIEYGIALYLEENGINLKENRPYFHRYISSHLAIIDIPDLKAYFLNYPIIQQVHQIAIEQDQQGQLAPKRVQELYRLMTQLNHAGLGSKYVPAIEIKSILGKNS